MSIEKRIALLFDHAEVDPEPLWESDTRDTETKVFALRWKDRDCAVKYIRLAHGDHAESRSALENELNIFKRLSENEGFVKLHAHAVIDTDDGFELFMLMDRLIPLRSVVREIAPDRVPDIARQLLTALAVCHKDNIAHRDIKPQNIFTDGRGRFMLGDFGISHFLNRNRDIERGTIRAMASPLYAAPEVMRQEDKIDWQRADVYSMALTLHYIRSRGGFPWTFSDEGDLLQKKRSGRLPEPDGASRDRLQGVIERGLKPRPADRFRSAAEMLRALDNGGKRRVRPWVVALCCAALLASSAAGFLGGRTRPAAQKFPATEALLIETVPEYGSGADITGRVALPKGSSFEDYRISVYLKRNAASEAYPKPSFQQPYVNLAEDGSFAVPYLSDPNDAFSEYLYVLLIPSDFAPGLSLDRTLDRALCGYVVIRSEDGGASVREIPLEKNDGKTHSP